MLRELKNSENPICADEMMERTRLNKGQMSKALQYVRRLFDNNKISVKEYIMSSPDGYFLPTVGKQVIAYVAQFYLDARSRTKTIKPIYEYAMAHWPNQLKRTINEKSEEEDKIDDEMEPWAVFNKIIQEDL